MNIKWLFGTLACFLIVVLVILILAIQFLNRHGTINPLNPLPYFVAMRTLNDNTPFARVSENVYITRPDDFGELIRHIEITHDVELIIQVGKDFDFGSDEKKVRTFRERYFGYNVFKLRRRRNEAKSTRQLIYFTKTYQNPKIIAAAASKNPQPGSMN